MKESEAIDIFKHRLKVWRLSNKTGKLVFEVNFNEGGITNMYENHKAKVELSDLEGGD